jgi:hypothetical protein
LAAADAKPAAGTSAASHTESTAAGAHAPVRQGWLPHHLKSQVHAAHWVASMHRAMPQASMGVRAGALVPPRGAVLSHTAARAESATVGKPGGNAKPTRSNARGDVDSDLAGPAEGDLARALQVGTAHTAIGGAGQFSGGMGSGADGGTSAQLLAQQALSDRGDHNAPGIDLGITGADGTAVIESPAQIAARLAAGETCWVQSFRLAMACAQCHPGSDIFVQAFNIVDSDGCVISSFSRKARLRASAEGEVAVQPQTPATAEGSDNSALMEDLASSPMLALSLRPVLDEAGEPAAALHNIAPAELSQLRHLFERMLPAGLRDALCAAAGMQIERWQAARACEDFDQRVAHHGDALERELND